MHHLGKMKHFLGIDIQYHSTGLHLSQESYARSILNKPGMSSCKAYITPMSTKDIFHTTTDPQFSDPAFYQSIVGALQYLTITRPELGFAVNSVCQHMHQPKHSHVQAVKQILHYLQGTVAYDLHYSPGSLSLQAFADAGWAGYPVDCKFTTGYCVYFGNNPIIWCAKKQSTISRSSTEAEYRALASMTTKTIWIRMILQELRVPISMIPVIWCDNLSAISLASNPVFSMTVHHVSILDQHADILKTIIFFKFH